MTKEQLKELGLTDEQAEKAAAASKTELEGFVPRTRLTEESEKVKGLTAQLADRDKDIAELKKTAEKGSDAEKRLADMETKYKTDTDALNAAVAQIKLDAALDTAILGAKGRNPKAIKALVDASKLKLKDDGTVEGLDLASIQKSDPYLFEIKETNPRGNGFQPGSGGDQTEYDKMSDADYYAAIAQKKKE